MKDKIKKWYKMGLWNKSKVMDAVAKGIITEDEVKEILSEKEA